MARKAIQLLIGREQMRSGWFMVRYKRYFRQALAAHRADRATLRFERVNYSDGYRCRAIRAVWES